jgi:hypothetical protein
MLTTILLCRPEVLALLSQPLYHSLPDNLAPVERSLRTQLARLFWGGTG